MAVTRVTGSGLTFDTHTGDVLGGSGVGIMNQGNGSATEN